MKHSLFAIVLTAVAVAVTPAAYADNVLRVNITNDPPTISPVNYQENVASRILSDVYEGFTQLMPDGSNQPALATHWEPLEDGEGLRFHLRPDVRFHSGNPFTAHDVKFTYELMLNPETQATANARFLDNIVGAKAVKDGETTDLTGVTVVDDLTVDIEFEQPYPIFPLVRIQFLDRKFVEEHGPDWVQEGSAGTGPFKMVDWARGSAIRVEANDDYWGGRPAIDAIEFLVVPNPETVFAMFESGELDVADMQDSMFRQALRDPDLSEQIVSGPFAALWWMGMNANMYEPFADPRVREAVSLTIDREGLIASLFEGAANSTPGLVPPRLGGYVNPDASTYSYDPDRARALMAEAGYPDGEGLPPVQITGWPEIRDLLTYYAGQMQSALGMPVEINIVERTTWIRMVNAGEAALFAARWSAAYHDPAYYLEELFYSGSRFNRSRYNNPDYDALIVAARSETDPEARFELFRQAENILIEDWASFSLPNPVTASLVQPYVENVATRSSGASYLRDAVLNR